VPHRGFHAVPGQKVRTGCHREPGARARGPGRAPRGLGTRRDLPVARTAPPPGTRARTTPTTRPKRTTRAPRRFTHAAAPFTRQMLEYKNREGQGRIVALYCDDERTSGPAAALLFEKGFDNVYLLTGGLRHFQDHCPHLVFVDTSLAQHQHLPSPQSTPGRPRRGHPEADQPPRNDLLGAQWGPGTGDYGSGPMLTETHAQFQAPGRRGDGYDRSPARRPAGPGAGEHPSPAGKGPRGMGRGTERWVEDHHNDASYEEQFLAEYDRQHAGRGGEVARVGARLADVAVGAAEASPRRDPARGGPAAEGPLSPPSPGMVRRVVWQQEEERERRAGAARVGGRPGGGAPSVMSANSMAVKLGAMRGTNAAKLYKEQQDKLMKAAGKSPSRWMPTGN